MVARMLTDAGYDMAADSADWGLVVTDATAEADDACPDDALALVASRFGPPVVPKIVSMSQARRALLDAGVLADVDAALDAIPDPHQRAMAQIQWEYDTMVRRDNAWVTALGDAMGLDLDALFISASKYE